MRHISKALQKFKENKVLGHDSFITILNEEDVKGVAPIVCFAIQSDKLARCSY